MHCVLPLSLGSKALRAPDRNRRCLALLLCLIALNRASPAQQPIPVPAAELPNVPAAPAPAQITATGTISGVVVDSDGDSISEARITLTRSSPPQPASTSNAQPQPDAARVAVAAPDGSFTFAGVPPGPFQLSVTAAGFATQQVSGQLGPGEDHALPAITLMVQSATSVEVTASQADIAQAQVGEEEKQRVLGVVPNFYVSYISNPVPLSPRQKFQLAFRTMVDPVSFVLNGVAAGVQQADNAYAWGQGAQGYGKRYAAAYGTFLTGTLIGSAALPVLFKQDPRYFYKGAGSIHSRVLYALANAVICRGDNLHWQPNYSAILGGFAANGISNSYYPAPNRAGVELTFEGAAIGTGATAISNLLQEFLIHRLTPRLPPTGPAITPTPAAPHSPAPAKP